MSKKEIKNEEEKIKKTKDKKNNNVITEQKKEKKKKARDYQNLKKKAKIVAIICIFIIAIELIIMYIIKEVRESKITYVDTLYSIEKIDDDYYMAVGASNFRYSNYNNMFTYQYYDAIQTDLLLTTYAEQAKLVKYDKELNVVFEKTFETDYDSTFYDVKKVDDGFIVCGSYIYDKKQIALKTRDGLIAKYDLDGNFLWSKNYQLLGDTEFKKVLVEDDGFVVVGQSIYENTEIGNHDKGGGIIIKYDMDGNILWKNNFGGNKSGIFESIVKVDDGYIVCGKDAVNYGLLVKYDFEGNRIWVKNYANTDDVGMSDIKLKNDKLYIASSYNSSDEKDSEGNTLFKYDACIFVYDLNGELLDKYTIAGSDTERFNSLILLDDSIIAVGYTKSKDIDVNDLNYQDKMSEGILVKFSYDGKVIDTISYSGSKNENLNDVSEAIIDTADKINKTHPFVVVGYSNSKRSLFKGNNKDYYSKIIKYNEKLELLEEK